MPDGRVLEFSGVTKRFGAVAAVSDFSARVEPGVVTGFLGPNGAGKTTSLRILLGLVRATEGQATVGGVPYTKLKNPLQTVGAVLEASSFHPGRTAANHLAVYAQAAGLPASRVDEALGTVGLAEVGGRKVGGFSLGMRQRLGLAYALLGDPGVLVLDEPANGLDPEGIKWMRGLLRQLARQGRTVLVSSHLLTEVQQTADALLIIAQGRLVFQGGLNDLTDPSEYATVVDSPDRAALAAALTAGGAQFEVLRSGLTVRGTDPVEVGALAAQAGVALSALQRRGPALEEVFLDLVNGARVHASAAGAVDAGEPEPAADDAVAAVPVAAEADAEGVDGEVSAEADAVADAVPAESEPAEDDAAEAVTAVEPPHEHAAFSVASTGVIEVIPDEAPSSDAAPEDGEAAAEVADASADDAEAEPDVAQAESGSHVWAMPAATQDDVAEDSPEAEAAAEPEGASEAAEEPATDAGPEADAASENAEPAADAAPADDEAAAPAGPKLWTWPAEPDAPTDPATESVTAEAPESDGHEASPDASESAEPDSSEAAPVDAETGGEDASPWDEAPSEEAPAGESGRDEGPKTESDLEADRFFSAFDDHDDAAADGSGADAPSGLEPPADLEEAESTEAPEAPEAPAEAQPEPSAEPESPAEPDPEPGPKLWTWESAAEEAARASDTDDANEGGEPR